MTEVAARIDSIGAGFAPELRRAPRSR